MHETLEPARDRPQRRGAADRLAARGAGEDPLPRERRRPRRLPHPAARLLHEGRPLPPREDAGGGDQVPRPLPRLRRRRPDRRPRRLPARARRTARRHPQPGRPQALPLPGRPLPLLAHGRSDPRLPAVRTRSERGITTVAIHKAAPLGPVPMDPYKIDDVEGAAGAFPDINFEIIHSGLAFVTETAWALARYPNVYANFEITSSLVGESAEDVRKGRRRVPDVGRPGKADLLRRLDGLPLAADPGPDPRPGAVRRDARNLRDRAVGSRAEAALPRRQLRPRQRDRHRGEKGGDRGRRVLPRPRARTGSREPYSNWRKHLQESGELVAA